MKRKSVVVLVILIVIAACTGSFLLGYALNNNDNDEDILLYQGTYDPNKEIYVIGHKNPDLDTVCSAIALTELLKNEGINAVAAVCGDLPLEVEYILSLANKEKPVLLNDASGKQIIMVDYNTFEQGVDGMNNADIIAIIDHHGIGGTITNKPILSIIEPVGSTASIISQLYYILNNDMKKETAFLLLVALIDDTNYLQLRTTTELDKYIYNELRKISGINNITNIYADIIKIEANYDGLTDQEIFEDDSKPFTMEGITIIISDVKAVGNEEMEKMVQRMKGVMKTVYPKQSATHLYTIVSDVINEKSELLYYGEGSELVVQEAFPVDSSGRIIFDHVASRKLEIVPALRNAYIKLSETLNSEEKPENN